MAWCTPLSLRLSAADWLRFGAPNFRTFHYLALCQGVVAVLAGFDVVIPFALAIGLPPFLAVLLGVVPLAGGMAQLLMPRLLDRTDGNLRGLTVLFAAISEPRGLYLALLVVLIATGSIGGPAAFVLLFLLTAITSIFSSVASSNLLSWYSAILPEPERRLVVPRMMAVSLAIGALLLIPMAAVLDALAQHIGLYAYALPFVLAGVLGIAEILVLRRLRHPGRVIVPPVAPRGGRADGHARPLRLPAGERGERSGHGLRAGHVGIHDLCPGAVGRVLDDGGRHRDADTGRRSGHRRFDADPRFVGADAAPLLRDPRGSNGDATACLAGHRLRRHC